MVEKPIEETDLKDVDPIDFWEKNREEEFKKLPKWIERIWGISSFILAIIILYALYIVFKFI